MFIVVNVIALVTIANINYIKVKILDFSKMKVDHLQSCASSNH